MLSVGDSMTHTGRRRLTARLVVLGDLTMTSGDPARHNELELEESGDTPMVGSTAATATERVAATCSSAERQFAGDLACGSCSDEPTTGLYR